MYCSRTATDVYVIDPVWNLQQERCLRGLVTVWLGRQELRKKRKKWQLSPFHQNTHTVTHFLTHRHTLHRTHNECTHTCSDTVSITCVLRFFRHLLSPLQTIDLSLFDHGDQLSHVEIHLRTHWETLTYWLGKLWENIFLFDLHHSKKWRNYQSPFPSMMSEMHRFDDILTIR